ncbi:hypothetical protein Syun_022970 [Stephania yunnanensis]|uniref:Uncharacterized protein n=1 Tax=Stephania yunnanensis TaxID=152371 RepID=A0AAP0FMD3_9MAGN
MEQESSVTSECRPNDVVWLYNIQVTEQLGVKCQLTHGFFMVAHLIVRVPQESLRKKLNLWERLSKTPLFLLISLYWKAFDCGSEKEKRKKKRQGRSFKEKSPLPSLIDENRGKSWPIFYG